ncbi:MAG: hypothetical protein H6702_06280 [Myxococcales bacterium]|nr:hypothetical protein [Myxococcales bacterium]
MTPTLAYALRRAAASVRRSPKLQAVALATIALAAAVLLTALGALHAVDRAADRWQAGARVVAFLGPSLPADRLEVLRLTVATWEGVDRVRLVDTGEAVAELRRTLGADPELRAAITPDLVPPSLEIDLAPPARTPEALSVLASRLQAQAGVEAVDWGADLLERLEGVRRGLELAGLGVAALVALAVIFIISNTVRLALYARREELAIMQLVGASHGFIRVPYHLEAAFQGAGGAGLAALALWATHRTLLPGPDPSLAFEALRVPLPWPPAGWILAVVVGAAAVGVLASHLATGRYLRGADG